ncbi:MAG: hypothetical protein AOA66_1295 [Candidatus Bathyarchaeota archaeon BA2]|nr:MAG: hypothetical protein AOA66_1295 [Candidatus Bathyarchaeota archaeon BA2]
MPHSFMSEVLKAFRKQIRFTDHAFHAMYSAERMVTVDEVIEALLAGDVVEDYADDPRGHSCLVLGYTRARRPVHVVCAPKDEFLAVITAYEPSLNKWVPDFKARRKA